MKQLNKNIIKKIFFVAGILGIITILIFAILNKKETAVENVKIVLQSNNPVKLINEKDILNYLFKITGGSIKQQDITKLNILKIEHVLDRSKFIKNAEVFIGTNNILTINCVLNDPIMRVTGKQIEDFYFDADGHIIPLSKHATCRVPLLSGYLNRIDFNHFSRDSSLANILLDLGRKINEDQFLNALIEQIYVENNGKLIMIPKVGHQKLEFGSLSGIDEKLEKIRVFYKSGMAGSGWKKFNRVNLEWEGQVVGSI